MRISFKQSGNNRYECLCESPGPSVYVLYLKQTNRKTPQINYYKHPHITCLSVWLLKTLYVFLLFVMSVWYSAEWLYWNFSLTYTPVTGSTAVL